MASDRNFCVVGSGVAGLVGAVTAAAAGLRPVIIEKSDLWGGTTALSGGVVWAPGNDLMARDGQPDSPETARDYVLNLVGNDPSARRRAKVDRFLEAVPQMVRDLAGQGIDWIRNPDHPDYYPLVPGSDVGRTIEPAVIDGNRLGPDMATMRGMSAGFPQMPTSQMGVFSRMKTGPRPLFGALSILARNKLWRMTGREPLSRGRALLAWLMLAARRHGIPLLLQSRLVDLELEDGRVARAVIETPQGREVVDVSAGVLLAAGGFGHNPELRRKYHGDLDGSWSSAPPPDEGDGLLIATRLGAAVEFTEHAWWQPTLMIAPGQPSLTLAERAMPGSIIVDSQGRRFMNEAQSYMAAGALLREHGRKNGGGANWLLFDQRFLDRYVFRVLSYKATRASMMRHGYLKTAPSLEALAGECGIDAASLRATVDRFNAFAREGRDHDFQRGETNYDRYWADPANRPNPCLGEIARGPFYAVRVFDGDIGTNGGVMTDRHSRVLKEDETPIPGLYAAGNCSGSPFGGTYPGGGATIGAAAVFGYLAARHAAGLDPSTA